jgi:DNA repair protein RecO
MPLSRTTSDKIFTLKQIPVGEADAVFIVFGKHIGKQPLFAKGIRKVKSRKRGNILTGFFSDVSLFKGSGMYRVVEGKLLEGFEELDQYVWLERVLFVLNHMLIEESTEPVIFAKLQELVKSGLSEKEVNKFRLFLLKELGFVQPLQFCSVCGDKKSVFLNLSNISTYCNDCVDNDLHFSKELVHLNRVNYSSPMITEMLDNYIREIIWG